MPSSRYGCRVPLHPFRRRRRTRTYRRTALLVALLAVLAGAALPGVVPPAGAAGHAGGTGGTLRFAACPGARAFRCATLDVPLSYAAPHGATLGIAVVELPATAAHPVGDLVMNPGGPGASGVQFLEQQGTSFPAALRRRFNLVSFDPRGIGKSDPVRCVGPAGLRSLMALDPAPVDAAEARTVATATKAFVAACLAHTSRTLLEHVGTDVAAHDLDRLRAALGQSKLDYLGFSYGTYLGERYAADFPHRVRAMVLDGVVNPAMSTAATDLAQAKGFEQELHDFFAWCSTDAACGKELAGGAESAYSRLFAELSRGVSIPGYLKPQFGGTQQVDLGVAETGLDAALYAKADWPYLAQGIAGALRGNASLLAALADNYIGLQPDGSYANLVAANAAISCVDRPGPRSLSAIERLSRTLAKAAPDFGAAIAWSSLTCAEWPIAPQAKVGPIRAPGTPTILVVGSTGDPATPYPQAVAVAHQLAHAVLLTRDGPGHTAYFSSACVRARVDTYLLTLRTPPAGTVCPSN